MAGVDAAETESETADGTRGSFGDPHDVVGDSGTSKIIVAFLLAAVDQCRSYIITAILLLLHILRKSSIYNVANTMTNFNRGSFPSDSSAAFLLKGNATLSNSKKHRYSNSARAPCQSQLHYIYSTTNLRFHRHEFHMRFRVEEPPPIS